MLPAENVAQYVPGPNNISGATFVSSDPTPDASKQRFKSRRCAWLFFGGMERLSDEKNIHRGAPTRSKRVSERPTPRQRYPC